MAKHWAEQNEVAPSLFLKATFFLVTKLPSFIVKCIVFIVVSVYFLFLKNQRENIINFRKNVAQSGGKISGNAYANFYNFGVAICDKIAIWTNKKGIEIDRTNLEKIRSQLDGVKRGKILLTSHYGNIEVAKALVSELGRTKINIFMYRANNAKFNEFMDKISGGKINVFWVDELNIETMLNLGNLLDNGEHIAIMADRVPIKSEKVASAKFLGKTANFSIGAYLIAGILKAEIYSFWCYKVGKKYTFETKKLPSVELKSDKIASVMPALRAYVADLESKCVSDPAQWYNFFDFWGQGEKEL
ncbi:hypothetical protein PF026_06605 [Campylobacter sp. CS_NA3]|uniref:hypothetical protein n=1 Tax=unclassified Campylobacter TaxID=2593542 RepID=UPI0022EA0C9C|nr:MULTISPECIES: hypothetical protein [unclassified Campylobacter]MDA3079364.1 hypothetical protein [Campylobacter sp. CS_NA2]WBR51016.1 hypothetical protein PF026_06605 [Campylobacter sp. CS_NA3]